jgi:hypothetical protein
MGAFPDKVKPDKTTAYRSDTVMLLQSVFSPGAAHCQIGLTSLLPSRQSSPLPPVSACGQGKTDH